MPGRRILTESLVCRNPSIPLTRRWSVECTTKHCFAVAGSVWSLVFLRFLARDGKSTAQIAPKREARPTMVKMQPGICKMESRGCRFRWWCKHGLFSHERGWSYGVIPTKWSFYSIDPYKESIRIVGWPYPIYHVVTMTPVYMHTRWYILYTHINKHTCTYTILLYRILICVFVRVYAYMCSNA